MKNKISTLLMLMLVSIVMTAQTVQIGGVVTDENGVGLGNDSVFVFNLDENMELNGPIAETIASNSGFFFLDVEVADLYDSFIVRSVSCPSNFETFTTADIQDTLEVQIYCSDINSGSDEFLYIGGNPDESGSTWLFISSPFGPVQSYSWTIDGQNFSTEDVVYTFPNPGNYLVELTTQMMSGAVLYASMEVNISESISCDASFFPYLDSLSSSPGVYFMNSSSGENLVYNWDFGDGSSSSEPYPVHVYEEEMDYTVCLTVYNESCADTACLTITENMINPSGSGIGLWSETNNIQFTKSNGFTFEVIPFPQVLSNRNAIEMLDSKVYPNPSAGAFTMTLFSEEQSAGYISVHDVTGKVVYQRSAFVSSGENNYTFDLNHLPEGMYMLVYQNEATTAVQKLNIVK